MTASSRRFLLREQTCQQHSAVDTAVGSFDTLERYRLYLQGLHAFRLPLEARLDEMPWPAHFSGWRPCFIGDLILRDMDDLNVTMRAPAHNISIGRDLESLMGVLYVLQGSSLGARILYGRARDLGLSEAYGARHLAGQAQSQDWKTYLQFLDSAPQMDMDRVVEASRAAFALAETAFRENIDA